MSATVSIGFIRKDIETQLSESRKLVEAAERLSALEREPDEERRPKLIQKLKSELLESARIIIDDAEETSNSATGVMQTVKAVTGGAGR